MPRSVVPICRTHFVINKIIRQTVRQKITARDKRGRKARSAGTTTKASEHFLGEGVNKKKRIFKYYLERRTRIFDISAEFE